MVVTPNSPSASLAVQRARDQYRRVLSAWARDALALRRQGLDRPGARRRSHHRRAA
ncbi:MAG: hypothetical protein JNJ48_06380 [Phycisphaerae bacterium]|nr:hypothetical protein [Phycisphaerae bacterium]